MIEHLTQGLEVLRVRVCVCAPFKDAGNDLIFTEKKPISSSFSHFTYNRTVSCVPLLYYYTRIRRIRLLLEEFFYSLHFREEDFFID